MRGKLNSFQKTMLQWNHLHAYNAVHVVRMTGDLDLPRLTGVINEFLAQRGLTHLTLELIGNCFLDAPRFSATYDCQRSKSSAGSINEIVCYRFPNIGL